MKTLIVYDSLYGNTEKIAQAVAEAAGGDVTLVSEVAASDLMTELLVVGSPTQGGRPTPAIQKFLHDIPANGLQKIRVAAFDTRFEAKERRLALRFLMGIIGYAAPRIATGLKARGGHLVTEPQGFIVTDKTGPLKPGELDRATAWAGKLLETD